ncbi:MAG TPA: hypothetical protein VHW25_09615 [Steroidobacteraceae bacterium]|jgi:hypothetical protein|nr:hypothetical protein [Steroidobacteraceae bacterium]
MRELKIDEVRRALLAVLPGIAVAFEVQAQDAAVMQPQSYRVALENEYVRVLDFNSRPGMGVCGNGMHSHPPHLTVLLTEGSVRIKTADGKIEEQRNMPLGTVFWEPAVTHTVENVSGAHMRGLLIEVKGAKS